METGLIAILGAAALLASKGILSELAKGAGQSLYKSIKNTFAITKDKTDEQLNVALNGDEGFQRALCIEFASLPVDEQLNILASIKTLQSSIRSMPVEALAKYAVDVSVIESAKDITFQEIEGGIKSDRIKSDGAVSFKGVKSLPGK